jgi:UDP-galactopyranose mutase
VLTADYVVVGSGLTGATVARLLHDAGRQVLVLERRPVVGGNVVDAVHQPSGIRYGLYGPHYFRTNSDKVWEFVQRFGEWRPFEARVKCLVDGRYESWPLSKVYLDKFKWLPSERDASNLEERALQLMPRTIYEKFVKGYNEKQWGRPCTELLPSLCSRFDIREDDDRLSLKKHQALPKDGYSALMERMLHGVPCLTNTGFFNSTGVRWARKKLIYTGPIDEYFGFDLGWLEYRGQRRDITENGLRYLQVNFPGDMPYATEGFWPWPYKCHALRAINWRFMQEQDPGKDLTTWENPYTPTDSDASEYPVPTRANADLAAAYSRRADALPGVVFAGRLGRYKYLDMDEAIGAAMRVAEELLK